MHFTVPPKSGGTRTLGEDDVDGLCDFDVDDVGIPVERDLFLLQGGLAGVFGGENLIELFKLQNCNQQNGG